jgi:hypothetical protein
MCLTKSNNSLLPLSLQLPQVIQVENSACDHFLYVQQGSASADIAAEFVGDNKSAPMYNVFFHVREILPQQLCLKIPHMHVVLVRI